MIKRNSSTTTSSSSNTDGSESTSCKKMKSNSGDSGEKEGIEGEESSSSERSVTRNGNIESTEKLLLDVTDEVMMMKKTSPPLPSFPHSTITPSSLPSAPLSSPSSHSLSSSSQSNKKKKSRNHSTESNRSNIMTTSPGISSKEVGRGEHLTAEEERHSLREGEEKHSMKEEGKVTEFTSSSHSPVGWHPHVYHQTPKKFTAFSILDILSRDPSSSPSSSSFLPTESSTNNKNNMNSKNLEKRDLTCNNKLNPNQRSSIISASLSHNASQSALHSSSPPILLPPPSVVPSSSSSLSSSPLLLHQLHRNKSTEAEALISNHSTSSPILPLSSLPLLRKIVLLRRIIIPPRDEVQILLVEKKRTKKNKGIIIRFDTLPLHSLFSSFRVSCPFPSFSFLLSSLSERRFLPASSEIVLQLIWE